MARFVRRLQKIGNSILVTLPKEWVEANGLEKGGQVELETGESTLAVSAGRRGRPRELVIPYPLPEEENMAADITGGYLLGYDSITVRSESAIPATDRELVRDSMRRLVGMEIMEEGSAQIRMQFLLDIGAVQPDQILRRISSIASGMFSDVADALVSADRSGLGALRNRDLEVNRQYFLLVRLTRSASLGAGLAGAPDMENIDVLDYRVAANLLENGGDEIVELGRAVAASGIAPQELSGLYGIVRGFGEAASKSIDAFVNRDRLMAIEAISMHREYQEGLAGMRADLHGRGAPAALVDLAYMFGRASKPWKDVADLVTPIYGAA